MKPRLTFFCELESGPLAALMTRPLLDQLRALDASVSLGLIDLSPERARVVNRLNRAGIPVIAWLLLPKDEGYWFNTGNWLAAARRYGAFCAWTAEFKLRWSGVGLDIETDIGEMRQLLVSPARLAPVLLRRLLDTRQLDRAQAAYTALVEAIRADGYPVDSYTMPLLVDERRAGSHLLRRLAGWVDLPVDREVLMLYSSFYRPYGHAILASYAGDAPSAGLGVTGGGVEIDGVTAPAFLSWDEFRRDLLTAARFTRDVHIFSLEGCVRQGWMERLLTLDWSARPTSAPVALGWVERGRALLRVGLAASARPWAPAVAAALLLLFRPRHRR